MPGTGLAGGVGGSRGACSQEPQSYDPSWGPIRPFFSAPTECSSTPLRTRMLADNWHTDVTLSEDSVAPLLTDCDEIEFPADIALRPGERRADSPTGLDVDLAIPQNNDPPAAVKFNNSDSNGAPAYWDSVAGRAVSHLKDTEVTLPEGFSINPSAANGQGVCTTQQIGLTSAIGQTPITFDNDDPSDGQGHECPQSAKIGTATVQTPLLEQSDWPTGEVYLAAQNDNPFGSNYAIYLVLRSVERGLTIKLAGKVEPDPNTGQIRTVFADNPQLPFDRFELHFKGGPGAALATSPICGSGQMHTELTPYSDPGNPVVVDEDVAIDQGADGGACVSSKAARALDLGFAAGTTSPQAGKHSPFTLRLTRPDGNQEIDSLEVTTPPGFAATLKGVPYCSEAAIAKARARTASGDGALEKSDPSCPAAAQVGTTTIGAGAGSTPFYVGGKAYFAGPYRGAPVSLVFVVPAVAGPFDLGVQVVRAALYVNPVNAQITAKSDPIPQILAGVPLRIRDIRVDVDRDYYTVNPTNCSPLSVEATVHGASGATAKLSNPFQVDGCANLGFKPDLKLQLFGATRRAAYPRLKATLTAREGDASIARAAVTLPHSAFLAQEHIVAPCTRVRFAADDCPPGSIYGQATAVSPLLDQPLTGPVYLRTNGGERLLPDLVAVLRGPDDQPIEIELEGHTDSKNGGIRNTFELVPDAPVTKFTLELMGGRKSLIRNSVNLCRGTRKATVRFNAQNGRKRNFRTPVSAPSCGKAGKGSERKRTTLAALVLGAF